MSLIENMYMQKKLGYITGYDMSPTNYSIATMKSMMKFYFWSSFIEVIGHWKFSFILFLFEFCHRFFRLGLALNQSKSMF